MPAWIVESSLLKRETARTADGNRVPVMENTFGRMPGRAKDFLVIGCVEDVVKSLARLRCDINNIEVGVVCDTLSVVLQQELVVVLRLR